MSTSHSEHASTKPDVVALADLASGLLEQARSHHSQRAAKTVVSGESMRATVIALAGGAELADHDAPPAATVQVISGQVRVHAGDQDWTVDAGEVLTIPPLRHGLVAVSDAAILLTVALR